MKKYTMFLVIREKQIKITVITLYTLKSLKGLKNSKYWLAKGKAA